MNQRDPDIHQRDVPRGHVAAVRKPGVDGHQPMRAKLAQRRHHGDWREMAASTVMDALRGEVEELRNAFFGCCDPEDIISEAVDVAAYAAILVDVLSMEGER
jgi:hypothetical protein